MANALLDFDDLRLRRQCWNLTNGAWECNFTNVCESSPLACTIAVVSSFHNPENPKAKSILRIYSGSTASVITCVQWFVSFENLVHLQWVDNLDLAAVFNNGCVRVFSPYGERKRLFYLTFQGTREVSLRQMHVCMYTWGAGIVYISKETCTLHLQRGFDQTRVSQVSIGEFALDVSSVIAIPNAKWEHVLVCFCTSSGDGIYYATIEKLLSNASRFKRVLVQVPNTAGYTRMFACKHPRVDGHSPIALGNSQDGYVAYAQYDGTVLTMEWQANLDGWDVLVAIEGGLVAARVDSNLVLLGSSGIAHPLVSDALLTTPSVGGGLWVYTQSTVQFFKPISQASILILDESHVANQLHEIYRMHKHQQPLACNRILELQDITTAIDTCIDAAFDEWDTIVAKELAECAMWGNMVSDFPKSTKFTQFIACMRIVNALRTLAIDIRVNVQELVSFGFEGTVLIVSALGFYLHALRICNYIGMSCQGVLLNWTSTRVRLGGHLTDQELLAQITRRLEGYVGVSVHYAQVASTIYKENRKSLALAILNKERNIIHQYKTLVEWNEVAKAANIAANAGNVGLVNYLVATLDNDTAFCPDLYREKLFKNLYLRHSNLDSAQLLHERLGNVYEAGLDAATRAMLHAQEDKDAGIWLTFADGFFKTLSNNPNAQSWHECIEVQNALYEIQASLESQYPQKLIGLVGKSIAQTLCALYAADLVKEAQQIESRFQVPHMQLWRCKLAAMYKNNNTAKIASMALEPLATNTTLKGFKSPQHVAMEALSSMGATAAIQQVAATMPAKVQRYWLSKIKPAANWH
ncbi:bifunctional Vps16 [Babesia duncani]|uniref:Bifunctional Vps16 n=1 Tax=Babesia duncani TaxID=323732 RepID=A0AAD9PMV5_9APIC|nr:bifunctional Vps16 [Babesia duncani]